MENLRKRSRIKFVSTPQQAEVFAQQATFKSFQIISDDLESKSFKSSSVIWKRPTPVGAAILDLSKLISMCTILIMRKWCHVTLLVS